MMESYENCEIHHPYLLGYKRHEKLGRCALAMIGTPSHIPCRKQNPLKAVAEFVENSIDASPATSPSRADREKDTISSESKTTPGIPVTKKASNFIPYHSHLRLIKRQLNQWRPGMPRQFGHGLLSFWTVGEELLSASPAKRRPP